jgi:hypothetical protein
VGALQRDHNMNPAIIPQRTWRNLYIQGKTPQQAADRAAVSAYNRRYPSALAQVKVTASRAAVDFAACMRELADIHFPQAERIRVVLDNLSTHSAGALYQTFPAPEARLVDWCCADWSSIMSQPAG